MKKIFLPVCAMLFFTGFFISCKKDIFQKDSCRLERWQGLDDGYLRTLHYNAHGLLDEWNEIAPLYEEDLLFTFEYDNHKRIHKMKYYDHNDLLFSAIMEYRNGHITREFWYVADTQTPDDTVVNTYNARGLIVKRESLSYDYYANFTYDAIGNCIYDELLGTDGSLFLAEFLSFNKPVREPMIAVPGLPYGIPFANYPIDKLKYTYYKQVFPDDDGNLVTGYEHDTEKSVPLIAGPEGFAIYYNTFDNVSQLYNRQVWHYENCGCDNNEEVKQLTTPSSNISIFNSTNQRRHYVSMVQMRDWVKQVRNKNKK